MTLLYACNTHILVCVLECVSTANDVNSSRNYTTDLCAHFLYSSYLIGRMHHGNWFISGWTSNFWSTGGPVIKCFAQFSFMHLQYYKNYLRNTYNVILLIIFTFYHLTVTPYSVYGVQIVSHDTVYVTNWEVCDGVTNHWTGLLDSGFYTFWGYICYVSENHRPSGSLLPAQWLTRICLYGAKRMFLWCWGYCTC